MGDTSLFKLQLGGDLGLAVGPTYDREASLRGNLDALGGVGLRVGLRDSFNLSSGIGLKLQENANSPVVPLMFDFDHDNSSHGYAWKIFAKGDWSLYEGGRLTGLMAGFYLANADDHDTLGIRIGPAAWSVDPGQTVFKGGLKNTAVGLQVGLMALFDPIKTETKPVPL